MNYKKELTKLSLDAKIINKIVRYSKKDDVIKMLLDGCVTNVNPVDQQVELELILGTIKNMELFGDE